jgi:hypothetical protein
VNPTSSFRSDGKTRLCILEACFEGVFEFIYIHLTRSGGRQKDPGTLDGETVIRQKTGLFESASEVPKGASKVIACSGLRAFAP